MPIRSCNLGSVNGRLIPLIPQTDSLPRPGRIIQYKTPQSHNEAMAVHLDATLKSKTDKIFLLIPLPLEHKKHAERMLAKPPTVQLTKIYE